MYMPASVHIRITTENLKDILGLYQKGRMRMYAYIPTSGGSTGLGFLGNGSGAVMLIEAVARRASSLFKTSFVICLSIFVLRLVKCAR